MCAGQHARAAGLLPVVWWETLALGGITLSLDRVGLFGFLV